jgi:hypothetical protein
MNYEQLSEVVPDSVKTAARNYQLHRVMAQRTGLQDFSLPKIAEYLGGMTAARQRRWAPVTEGLLALSKLR